MKLCSLKIMITIPMYLFQTLENLYLDISRENSLTGRPNSSFKCSKAFRSNEKNEELSLEKHLDKEEKLEKKKQKLIKKVIKSFSIKKRPPTASTDFYHFEKVIGKGAYGKVFLGSAILYPDESVAIKSIDKAVMNNEIIKKRISQEILILKKLNHKNVVKLLEVFENKKNMFLVMEHMQHGDLQHYLKSSSGGLNEDTARGFFKQILDGLFCIHSNNILHRDIKLENLLVDNKNTVKICDFGISTLVMPGKKMTEQSGTPSYMAPEIVKGIEYEGFSSDVWSLGVVLYAMLTGEPPFESKFKTYF
jgi:serine/threonine protein kinase